MLFKRASADINYLGNALGKVAEFEIFNSVGNRFEISNAFDDFNVGVKRLVYVNVNLAVNRHWNVVDYGYFNVNRVKLTLLNLCGINADAVKIVIGNGVSVGCKGLFQSIAPNRLDRKSVV